jgi:hypothetical protein
MKYVLLLSTLFIISCKTGPQISVCVSTPSINGFECYNEQTQQSFVVLYADSDKYIGLSPADAQALLNYCGIPSQDAQKLSKIDVLKYAEKIQAAIE